MNCLLVLPRSKALDNRYIYPLGICLISSVLKRLPGLRLINLNLNTAGDGQWAEREIPRLMAKENIRVVLSGGLAEDLDSVRTVFRLAKDYDPSIVTVTGGPLVTGDPLPAMAALKFADYGILGEGERTVAELVQALKEATETGRIRGLVIKEAGGCRLTAPRENIRDWGEIPWPDYEGFGFDPTYHRPEHPTVTAPVYYSASRGCTFKCTFCHNSQGHRYRPRPLGDFFRELSHFVNLWGPHRVSIADDLLADSLPRLREFCAGMKSLGLKGWLISMRVSQITPEAVELLKGAGCGHVCLGLESASDRILKSMNKGITLKQMETSLAWLHQARLSFQGFFIFGDQEETRETARETLDWWRAHPEYTIGLGFIWLFPGSRLYKLALERGLIRDPASFLENILQIVNISKIDDEAFEELKLEIYAAQAARYEDPRHHLLDMVCDYDYRHAGVGLSGFCRYCSRPVNLRAQVGSYNPVHFCPHCGALFYYPDLAPVRLDQALLRQNIQLLLDRYGRLAFWGIGRLFRMNVDQETASRPGIHLIDKFSEGRYGDTDIEPPTALTSRDIKCVIVATLPQYPDFDLICEEINRDYRVEKIIALHGLQAPLAVRGSQLDVSWKLI